MSAHLQSKYLRLKCTIMYFFLFAFYKLETLLFLLKEELKLRVVLFISNCKITLHVSDAFCVHHQEY